MKENSQQIKFAVPLMQINGVITFTIGNFMKKLILNILAILTLSTSVFAQTFTSDESLSVPGLENAGVKAAHFSSENVRAMGRIKLITGPGVRFNRAYPWCWLMSSNNNSYISVVANFDKKEIKKDWYLNIKQLSSICGPTNYSPIAIDVNGVNIVDHFNPLRDAWRIDHFKISEKLLSEGENSITIRFQDGYTHYWIEHLILSPNEPVEVWIW